MRSSRAGRSTLGLTAEEMTTYYTIATAFNTSVAGAITMVAAAIDIQDGRAGMKALGITAMAELPDEVAAWLADLVEVDTPTLLAWNIHKLDAWYDTPLTQVDRRLLAALSSAGVIYEARPSWDAVRAWFEVPHPNLEDQTPREHLCCRTRRSHKHAAATTVGDLDHRSGSGSGVA